MIELQEEFLEQVERIAKSDTFRNSQALQRLLRYLGEKVVSGEAAQLKEYTVGVEGLGRSSSYNPTHDAAARVLVGRLRQKLSEYYSGEGKNDRLLLNLPKGGFKLSLDKAEPMKPPLAQSSSPIPTTVEARAGIHAVRNTVTFVLGVLVIAALSRLVIAERRLSRTPTDLSPALEEVWRPFVVSDRPVIIMIADPLFVQFKGFGTYRELVINSWAEAKASATVATIRKALKNPQIERSSRYTGVSEANAAFLLGKTLATHVPHISLARSSEFSWSQLANNNVVFVGAERIIEGQLQSLPVEWEFIYDFAGVRNVHPRRGEPGFFADAAETRANPPSEDGESYALISRIPGPAGQGEIQTFVSNSAPARMAAVQLATSPDSARDMMDRLKASTGHVPRYYQMVLNVKFKGGVPTETSYVTAREVHLKRCNPNSR